MTNDNGVHCLELFILVFFKKNHCNTNTGRNGRGKKPFCARCKCFHGGRDECVIPTRSGLPFGVTLSDICGGVDLASPAIKHNLNNI